MSWITYIVKPLFEILFFLVGSPLLLVESLIRIKDFYIRLLYTTRHLTPIIISESTLGYETTTITPKTFSPNIPKDLFDWFMQTYLQEHRPSSLALTFHSEQEDVSKRLLNTRNHKVYYRKPYMETYYFCR